MTPNGDPEAARWLKAVRTPEIAEALESIYTRLGAAIHERKPRCEASGRCCRFQEWGHRLYVTGLEAAYAVDRLRAPAQEQINTGATSLPVLQNEPAPPPPLTAAMIDEANRAGGCPFQIKGLCSIHTIKPLGCRIYFCDPDAQEWQQSLHEELLRDIRAIHETHDIDYRYMEWRAMLQLFCEE